MEFKGKLKKICGRFPDYGAIFLSNSFTLQESFEKRLFALPTSYANFVKGIKTGMVLFLFEYEERKLHGVFRAASDGELNIDLNAYSSSGKQYPAQVRVTTIWDCYPLSEREFRHAIQDNYFAAKKFNFGLSKDQVQRLLQLFSSRRRIVSPSYKESITRELYHIATEKDRSNQTESATRKLKEDINTISCSIPEPLAYSEKSIDSHSQLLTPGNSDSLCKESESMRPSNCMYFPYAPSIQSSSTCVSSHSFTSQLELGPDSDHATNKQLVYFGEEPKELGVSLGCSKSELEDFIPLVPLGEADCAVHNQPIIIREDPKQLEISSGSFSTAIEDFIPLLPPDDSAPLESATPVSEAGCFSKNQTFCSSAPLEGHKDLSFSEYVPRMQNGDNFERESADCPSAAPDFSNHRSSIRGLYSDAQNERSSVFSRLNFTAKAKDNEGNTQVDKPVSRISRNKRSTEVEKSVQEIIEDLQVRHDIWKTEERVDRHHEKKNVQNVKKRTSVFLRLGKMSEVDVKNNRRYETTAMVQKWTGEQGSITKVEYSVSESEDQVPSMISLAHPMWGEYEEMGKRLAPVDLKFEELNVAQVCCIDPPVERPWMTSMMRSIHPMRENEEMGKKLNPVDLRIQEQNVAGVYCNDLPVERLWMTSMMSSVHPTRENEEMGKHVSPMDIRLQEQNVAGAFCNDLPVERPWMTSIMSSVHPTRENEEMGKHVSPMDIRLQEQNVAGAYCNDLPVKRPWMTSIMSSIHPMRENERMGKNLSPVDVRLLEQNVSGASCNNLPVPWMTSMMNSVHPTREIEEIGKNLSPVDVRLQEQNAAGASCSNLPVKRPWMTSMVNPVHPTRETEEMGKNLSPVDVTLQEQNVAGAHCINLPVTMPWITSMMSSIHPKTENEEMGNLSPVDARLQEQNVAGACCMDVPVTSQLQTNKRPRFALNSLVDAYDNNSNDRGKDV